MIRASARFGDQLLNGPNSRPQLSVDANVEVAVDAGCEVYLADEGGAVPGVVGHAIRA